MQRIKKVLIPESDIRQRVKELAAEIDADFLSIACPTPYRIVLTTNYVGYTGGLRVIEDIYNTSLATYK